MVIFLTILITLLVIFLGMIAFVKIATPYLKEILDKAIDVCCYLNTYHYEDDEIHRVHIGKEKFYKSLFKKKTLIRRNKSDFVFWTLYTKVFKKLLDCTPLELIQYNNRSLSEEEKKNIESFLDNYINKQEDLYEEYASKAEKEIKEANRICEASKESEEEK